MYLSHIKIVNHPILGNLSIDLINPRTEKPYSVVAFVGENSCGKTTLLNELFEYQGSKYFVEKEQEFLSPPHYFSLFLRQSSLARNAKKEIGKTIDGKDRYSPSNLGEWAEGFKSSNAESEKEKGYTMLKILNDPDIYKLYAEGAIDEIVCSADITEIINGKKAKYDISNYSSGQQEILLKLKDLKQFFFSIDSVLLDEPETSLHPRWQKEIINLIKMFVTDSNDTVPQIFVATHSEKVLESLIKNQDALLVRLYKENGLIKSETIDQMKLILPNPSFAELDYVIFNIDSYEYCSELYDLIEWKTGKKERAIDTLIRNSGFYEEEKHHMEWFNDIKGDITSYNIASYCRNYFHHPKDRKKPSDEQLRDAIELLRNVILNCL